MAELYIGVMSGTSLDGIDLALCEIESESCRLIASLEHPFDAELKRAVLNLIDVGGTLYDVGSIDKRLGEMYAHAINLFLQKSALTFDQIRAIGLHGQTLWHEPASLSPFSLQLGDANIVAATCNISVVNDFRQMDIANGGQGAPFAPAFHRFLFGSDASAVVNIGGMANLSLLKEPYLGFDTGPGNVLLDYWFERHNKRAYDKEGAWAASGRVNEELLHVMLEDAYFFKAPPKSTGREYFNAAWLSKKLHNFLHVSAEDVQRTLLELTARSIADALMPHAPSQIILCGGGVKNSFLLERLSQLCKGTPVQSSDALGGSSDYLEAMAFAWLAYKRCNKEAVDLCSVTGAEKPSILGALYEV